MTDMKIGFYGAAQNVTGSCYLVTCNDTRVLVDCGFYQERDFRHRNWEPFPFAPSRLDAVFLTHGHLDHCGLLPRLVRDGFKGRIYGTEATTDIAGIVMADSARIQEEDAAHKKRRHEEEGRRGKYPEEPLYTVEDAEACQKHLEGVRYDAPVRVSDSVSVVFRDAGHILGSAILHLTLGKDGDSRTLVFSGDLGRPGTPILRDPTAIGAADYVVMESTYGNRKHKDNASIPDRLAQAINETCEAGGNVVIPSFAVERAQELLYHLSNLLEAKRIPHLPVFLDSPMAVRVTEVFRRHPELLDEEAAALLKQGHHPCDFPGLQMSRSVDESKAIRDVRGTAIIIAGSGMCTGGRVKHHLKHNLGRPESLILFVGYQAVGTLGRRILEGAAEVRIHGKDRAVAARVAKVNGFSAHADQDELFGWVSGLERAPRTVFVTHGEEEATDVFANLIRDKKAWNVVVPAYRDEVSLA